ncbi:hypothetical protein H2200_005521 [Cladophialophora chaetospira]|uniref:Mediator of RNA polymerase II transcription subunit 4 n=1 Tax=Cladophialophora chaetospira TaxID=386627 RepID=A0AA38XCU0_9EURO|nr:hypothetical protein H2200_005521 [Cladophialophora chaetospira]
MDAVVLTPLNNIETHLNALITSLTQTNTFATAPQAAQSLLTDDDNLTSALSLLQRHQQNYARILNLREEVSTLQEQLKDTIRQCVSFKTEIGQINPTILDSDSDSDDEDDTPTTTLEIDYHTLLTFAARIGKHNTLAAKEAEADAVRRKIAAKNASSSFTSSGAAVNGTQTTELLATQDTTTLTAPDQPTQDDAEKGTAETTAELGRISDLIALERARMGLSFPDGAILRVGALGQLQLLRERAEQEHNVSNSSGAPEDEGKRAVEEAVDREVGRMVRETEQGIAEETKPAEDEEERAAFPESPVLGRREGPSGGHARRRSSGQGPVQRPPKEKKKLNLDLDFPDSDEDDD